MSTRLFPVFLVLLLAGAAATQDKAVWRVWEGEKKLIVVTTPDWDATHGTLTRFERRDHEWIKVS